MTMAISDVARGNSRYLGAMTGLRVTMTPIALVCLFAYRGQSRDSMARGHSGPQSR